MPTHGNVAWTQCTYQQLSMDVLAEFPQTGPPRVNYLYRGRAGAIVTMEEQQGGGAGKEYWFAQDGLGSTAAVTKQDGQSAHDYFYDPYGGIIDDNGHPEDSSNASAGAIVSQDGNNVTEEESMKGISVFERWLPVLMGTFMLVMLAGCSSQATQTPTSPPPLRVLSARGHLEEAWRLARQWRDDVELIQVQADILGPAQTGLLLSFKFESPSENQLEYGVTCSSERCFGQEFPIPSTWLSEGWMPIEFEDEMIDSVEAATIGYYNGGKRFAYMEDAAMSVRLGRDKPRDVGPIVWLAYYATFTESPLYVIIDPYTGEIIRTEE